MNTKTPEQWAIKIMNQPREWALSEIAYRKARSVDYDFWDEVQQIVTEKYAEIDKEQQEIEEYYLRELTDRQRLAVSLWVSDNIGNLTAAYKQIDLQLKHTRDRNLQTYWKYARRELNKARRAIT